MGQAVGERLTVSEPAELGECLHVLQRAPPTSLLTTPAECAAVERDELVAHLATGVVVQVELE